MGYLRVTCSLLVFGDIDKISLDDIHCGGIKVGLRLGDGFSSGSGSYEYVILSWSGHLPLF